MNISEPTSAKRSRQCNPSKIISDKIIRSYSVCLMGFVKLHRLVQRTCMLRRREHGVKHTRQIQTSAKRSLMVLLVAIAEVFLATVLGVQQVTRRIVMALSMKRLYRPGQDSMSVKLLWRRLQRGQRCNLMRRKWRSVKPKELGGCCSAKGEEGNAEKPTSTL